MEQHIVDSETGSADLVPVDFASLTQDESTALDRLNELFRNAAVGAGLLDVAYRIVDSPVGALLLAGTERGLVRVAFAREGHDAVLEALAKTVSPRVLLAPSRRLTQILGLSLFSHSTVAPPASTSTSWTSASCRGR